MIRRPENRFERYHAHVYFDAATLTQASALCTQAAQRFSIRKGRVHQRPVGPHPRWSCQLSFEHSDFEGFIAWLDRQRDGLTVFVHPCTGDDLADHTTHAAWLGDPAQLDLSMFND